MGLIHKHIDGLSIEIIGQTDKGYKVVQTELFSPWTNRRLKKAKVKTAFYSREEIKELFKTC